MDRYPYIVKIAWDVIEKFIIDWQKEPYRWIQEVDFQTEIASRLSTVYRLINYDYVIGNYDDAVSGFKNNQRWNRVSCEPKITYTYKDGKQYPCFPDIVVWDDIKNPNAPPDADGLANWPILWVCEVKLEAKNEENWDIEKMVYLLKQKIVKFGCWLNLKRKRTKRGNGIKWIRSKANRRLWICHAMLPATKK